MRIGFDGRWYNGSGVGTYVTELLNEFTTLSDEFELVLYEDSKNPVPLVNRSGISRVPVRSSKFSLASQFELRALCKSTQVDLFHIPYQYGAPLLLSCPLVVTVHDLTPFLFHTRSWPKQLLAVPLVKAGYRAAASRAHHIIADSANTARDLHDVLKVPPSRITPVHLAASEIPFHASNDLDEKERVLAKYGISTPYVVVSSAGCNWRTKNLETALQALALGREISCIDFQTVVYGPEKGLNVLAKRDLTFGLGIRRGGYVPVNDLGALFRNAQLFIMTSLYEGFGLPIVEAMACGCPVITSNGGSLAEVAGDGAQVFDPMDAQGMAETVAKLLRDPDERERWRNRALSRAANFSWRKTAEQTLAVYRRIYDSVRERNPEPAFSRDAQSTRY